MNLIKAVRSVYTKYATFSGRASRSEFWWYQLFYVVITGVPIAYISDAMDSFWSLVNLLPSLAVACRRLHDTDRSGWWQVLPIAAVPIFIAAFALNRVLLEFNLDELFGSPLIWIGVVVGLGLYVLLIVWWAMPGTPGPNRFGEDPIGRMDADVFS
ncbi:MAG: DUF805 domain-containing protein [Paracoccaceae bacterium]